MRLGPRFLFFVVTALGASAATGCTALVDFDPTQCAATSECTGRGPAYADTECSGDGFCVPRSGPSGACQTNHQCTADLGEPAICRTAGGSCTKLLSDNCPELIGSVDSDNAIVYGWVVSPVVAPSRKPYIELALGELNNKGQGIPGGTANKGRPLAFLRCIEDEIEVSRLSYKHLIDDVHVPAILGPNFDTLVVPLAQELAIPSQTMMLGKSATVSIEALEDEGLVWSNGPNETFFSQALVAAMPAVAEKARKQAGLMPSDKIKIAMVYDGDGDSVVQQYIFDHLDVGAINAQIDPFEYVGVSSLPTKVSEVVAAAPNIAILIGALETIDAVALAEKGWPTSGSPPPRPVYFFAPAVISAGDTALTDLATGKNITLPMPDPTLVERMLGVFQGIDTTTAAYKGFAFRFLGATMNQPDPGQAVYYDSLYVFALATLAAGQQPVLTGKAVATGVSKLVEGDDVSVGDGETLFKAFGTLNVGGSINLRGASGPLDYNLKTGSSTANFVVWCAKKQMDDSVTIAKEFDGKAFATYYPDGKELNLGTDCAP